MGRGGVWHAIVPKNAKIGPEVDFEYLFKMGPLGQGAKTHLRFFTEMFLFDILIIYLAYKKCNCVKSSNSQEIVYS